MPVAVDDAARRRQRRNFWPARISAPDTPGESLRIERVIALARMFLITITFVGIVLNPIDPPSYAPVAYLLLAVFAGHSLSALFVLRRRQRTTLAFALTTHSVDLLAAALTLPMAAPTNSFFAFFLFVLAAAAFRWGFRETAATTIAAIVLVILHAGIAAQVPALSLYGRYEAYRVLERAAYLAMMGLLLGYVAEESRSLREETAAIIGLLGKLRVDAGVTKALASVSQEVVTLLNASSLLLVVEDFDSRRLYRWSTSGPGNWTVGPAAEAGESTTPDRLRYLFAPPNEAAAVFRYRWPLWSRRFRYRITALDPVGRLLDSGRWRIPEDFAASHPFRYLVTAPVRFGNEWAGRLFVFDPILDMRLVAVARFVQTLVQQVGPAVFSVYLMGRLRQRATAMERARVARELHDGVIQSLIGVEMQLEVLRNQASLRDTATAADLARLQGVMRNEVLNLRELMQQMRPLEFDPHELFEHIAEMVERFGRDTGITARFTSQLKEVRLPPQICFELVRIVQEALVNVRKHSAAKNVLVRFGAKDGFWNLEIDDDGRGFPFEGRLAQSDLDAQRSGPVIIKERVRAIGGRLTIDSAPGRGARLEVLVPQVVHE